MNFKLLSCAVFVRELSLCIARSPHAIQPVFRLKGEHNEPADLQARLQAEIDAAEEEDLSYDAVLLAYGLCGNATLGLRARQTPLVIPRAHDCTTLFLGSKEAFQKHFESNPSQSWASVGYSERGESVISDTRGRDWLGGGTDYQTLVEQYGEENARYLMDSMGADPSTELVFIDVPETRVDSVVDRIRREARDENLEVRTLPGSIRLFEKLCNGDWPEEEFVVVPPGHKISAMYDYNEVLSTEPAEEDATV